MKNITTEMETATISYIVASSLSGYGSQKAKECEHKLINAINENKDQRLSVFSMLMEHSSCDNFLESNIDLFEDEVLEESYTDQQLVDYAKQIDDNNADVAQRWLDKHGSLAGAHRNYFSRLIKAAELKAKETHTDEELVEYGISIHDEEAYPAQRFLSKHGQLNPVYRRHFSELIKNQQMKEANLEETDDATIDAEEDRYSAANRAFYLDIENLGDKYNIEINWEPGNKQLTVDTLQKLADAEVFYDDNLNSYHKDELSVQMKQAGISNIATPVKENKIEEDKMENLSKWMKIVAEAEQLSEYASDDKEVDCVTVFDDSCYEKPHDDDEHISDKDYGEVKDDDEYISDEDYPVVKEAAIGDVIRTKKAAMVGVVEKIEFHEPFGEDAVYFRAADGVLRRTPVSNTSVESFSQDHMKMPDGYEESCTTAAGIASIATPIKEDDLEVDDDDEVDMEADEVEKTLPQASASGGEEDVSSLIADIEAAQDSGNSQAGVMYRIDSLYNMPADRVKRIHAKVMGEVTESNLNEGVDPYIARLHKLLG